MGIQLASVGLVVVLEIPVGIPVVALEEVQAVLVEDQVEVLVDLEILATAWQGSFGVVTQASLAVEVAEMEMSQEAILVPGKSSGGGGRDGDDPGGNSGVESPSSSVGWNGGRGSFRDGFQNSDAWAVFQEAEMVDMLAGRVDKL